MNQSIKIYYDILSSRMPFSAFSQLFKNCMYMEIMHKQPHLFYKVAQALFVQFLFMLSELEDTDIN